MRNLTPEPHDRVVIGRFAQVVFGEHAGDAVGVARLLGSRKIVIRESRSPLDDLRAMVHVGLLAVHGSSFSVLASILRAGPAISEARAPIHGRYAGNTYPCPLGEKWWWSPGFGRDDCPVGGFFSRPKNDGVRQAQP